MNRAQLVSVRLDPDDVKEIDNWARVLYYRNRSDIINAGVRLMAELIRRGQAESVYRFYPQWDVIDEFTLKYHRKIR